MAKKNTKQPPEKLADEISSDDEEIDEEAEMKAEAEALRQAIKEGAFDSINISAQSLSSKTNPQNDSDDKEDEEDIDETQENEQQQHKKSFQSKALTAKTLELEAERKDLSWLESFDITTSQPLPFSSNHGGNPLHVHDDLKREVAFYNHALEGVEKAKQKCHEGNVPFSRPEDFFAEMVKTDDHMAKVKDRLIFESKKIAAFGQRKSNKEQKLRSKEARSKKIQEKAKTYKDNLKAVDDWAKSASSNRLSNGKIRDGEDQAYMQKMDQNQKRKNLDKKYGHGGKKSRFKQMDKTTINDMSNYNPYGNFGGAGSKKRQGAGGNKRAGKRARDSMKQKR